MMRLPALSTLRTCPAILGGVVWLSGICISIGDVLDDLDSALGRIPVGDPATEAYYQREGPKGLVTEDMDRDGHLDLVVSNLDGTITLLYGDGTGGFPTVQHLHTKGRSLRGIATGNFTFDERPDIVAADPFLGVVYTFDNLGSRTFQPRAQIAAWEGARDLITGDFDNDGQTELVVAGPNKGMVRFSPNPTTSPAIPWFVEEQVIDTLNESSDVFTSAWVRNRRPVYALATTPGPSGERLLVGHARSSEILVYEGSPLVERGRLYQNDDGYTHAMRTGDLVGSPLADVAIISHNGALVHIHAGMESAPYFEPTPTATITTDGRARDVVITDVNGDGQNDLAIVLRDANLLAVYANEADTFKLVSQSVLGVSPRIAVSGDFDGDDLADLAIANRQSGDVSVLPRNGNSPGWLTPGIYSGAGDPIRTVVVEDLDQDGLDDRLYVTENRGEVAVSYSLGEGNLDEWQRYDMGGRITGIHINDLNGDDQPDIIASIWNAPKGGALRVRYGTGEAHFDEVTELSVVKDQGSFWNHLSTLDLDGDGDRDLVALDQDGNLTLLTQHETSFARNIVERIVEGPRDMRAVDLDDDGDEDLALLSVTGAVILIENQQNWQATRISIVTLETGQSGITNFAVSEEAPKLIFGSTELLGLHHLEENFAFETRPLRHSFSYPRRQLTRLDSSHFVSLTDLPGQIGYERPLNGIFAPDRKRSIPPTTCLASGDLDGDGEPDLVGSGSRVWTALSSQSIEPVVALPSPTRAAESERLVINEVMAWNKTLPWSGEIVDWLELYNGTPNSIDLTDWTLRLVKNAEEPAILDYLFPEDMTIPAGEHLLLVCSTNATTLLHTGFNLPKEGGQLLLTDSESNLVDDVTYGSQQRDRSYARTMDGGGAFHITALPDPGSSNSGYGNRLPIEVRQFDAETTGPDRPIVFTAELGNPIEVSKVTVNLRMTSATGLSTFATLPLFDDGTHQDRAAHDGIFRGVFPPGFPQGTVLEYFIEITNQSTESTVYPNAPYFARQDEIVTNFSLAWPTEQTVLQISEIVSNNDTGIVDEQGERSDWVELRNASREPISLAGYGLTQSLTALEAQRYRFPDDAVLEPGGYVLVYLDRNEFDSPFHAPFKLKSSGEALMFVRTRSTGEMELLETINVPALPADSAYARIGTGTGFHLTDPSPLRPNGEPGITIIPGETEFTVRATPETTAPVILEMSPTLDAQTWEAVHTPIPGLEFDYQAPRQRQAFYRLRELE